MIYNYETLAETQNVNTDICIIGSGAGGAAAAFQLSRQKKWRILVLEAGSFFTPKKFTQKEDEMYPELFYESGSRKTIDQRIRVVHGKGVGGSTIHNLNLCKKAPPSLFQEWNLPHLSASAFDSYYEKIRDLLQISPIESFRFNQSNLLFQKGLESLNYKSEILWHNRVGCQGSGFCELGCSFDAKMNSMKVLLPQAIQNGTEVFSETQALRFEIKNKKITALNASVVHPLTKKMLNKIKIKSKLFIVAGGAIESPLLLQRSKVPDPHHRVGKNLYLHPGCAVAGFFNEPVYCWKGIPQSIECTEFLNEGIWLIPSPVHPVTAASFLPGFGHDHRNTMNRYPQLSPLSVMIHDTSSGFIQEQDMLPKIHYQLNKNDQKKMTRGILELTKILRAAGASDIIIPAHCPVQFSTNQTLSPSFNYSTKKMDAVSVHPMGSLCMGANIKKSCADHFGKYHHLDNLFISDASLFPTSIGVPPQWTTYAMGLYIGDHAAKTI